MVQHKVFLAYISSTKPVSGIRFNHRNYTGHSKVQHNLFLAYVLSISKTLGFSNKIHVNLKLINRLLYKWHKNFEHFSLFVLKSIISFQDWKSQNAFLE